MTGPEVRAEVDYPVRLALPEWDVAVGLSGGVAFDEAGGRGHAGGLVGVDAGVLHGVFGLHVGLRTWREGWSARVGGLVEATVWYVALLGLGVRYGELVGAGGPDAPAVAVAFTLLVAVPWPIARLGEEGDAGTLVLAPYARPGMRFARGGGLRGFHELGVTLRWTSFGF